jgi:hypothetical protein
MQWQREIHCESGVEFDEDAARSAAQCCGFRPPMSTWRADPDSAPIGCLVYARRRGSACIMVARRDADGWFAVTRRSGLVSARANRLTAPQWRTPAG